MKIQVNNQFDLEEFTVTSKRFCGLERTGTLTMATVLPGNFREASCLQDCHDIDNQWRGTLASWPFVALELSCTLIHCG